MSLRLPIFGLLLTSACILEFDDAASRRCDLSHPCSAEKRCIDGFCVVPASSDAGPVDPGDGGQTMPRILWSQATDGFEGQFADPNCTVAIDRGAQNRLTATVAGSSGKGDSAVGEILQVSRLPRGASGRIRGKVTLTSALHVPGKLTFLWLDKQQENPTRPWLAVGMTPDSKLVVNSAPDTMAANDVTQSYQVPGGFPAGTYTIDVQWFLGEKRQVALNRMLVSEAVLPRATTGAYDPDRLRVGIRYIEGEDGGMTSLSVSDWQTAEDPTAFGPFP
jgi:hypothetical protein